MTGLLGGFPWLPEIQGLIFLHPNYYGSIRPIQSLEAGAPLRINSIPSGLSSALTCFHPLVKNGGIKGPQSRRFTELRSETFSPSLWGYFFWGSLFHRMPVRVWDCVEKARSEASHQSQCRPWRYLASLSLGIARSRMAEERQNAQSRLCLQLLISSNPTSSELEGHISFVFYISEPELFSF